MFRRRESNVGQFAFSTSNQRLESSKNNVISTLSRSNFACWDLTTEQTESISLLCILWLDVLSFYQQNKFTK